MRRSISRGIRRLKTEVAIRFPALSRRQKKSIWIPGAMLGFGAMLFGLWSAWIRPGIVARVEARLGHAVTIGRLLPTPGGFRAYDVTVYGRTPFEREPLAFVRSLEGHVGNGSWSRPEKVVLDGVDVRIFAASNADNVRGGAVRKSVAPRAQPVARGNDSRPVLVEIRNGRLQGAIALPGGHRAQIRAHSFEASIGANTATATVTDIVIEIEKIATARMPMVQFESPRPGVAGAARRATMLTGKGGSLSIPGGVPLLIELALDGKHTANGWTFGLTTPEGRIHDRVAIQLTADDSGLQLDARATELSLAGMSPMFEPRGVGVRDSTVDADLTARVLFNTTEIPFALNVQTSGVDLRHPSIDPMGWKRVPFSLRLMGIADRATRQIRFEQSEGRFLAIPFNLSGETDFSAAARGKLTLTSPNGGVACEALLDAQPAPVREALAGMQLGGKLAFNVSVGFDSSDWEEVGLDIQLPKLCSVLAEPDVIARSRLVLETGGAGQLEGRPDVPVGTDHPDFTPLGKIPSHVIGAFLSAEDNAFFTHNGFQVEMIRRALAYNLERGRLQRGASTITQQLAKNLFLSHERTLSRKISETVLTWRLDRILPKRRVLELYLNVIDLGPHIRGIAQASQRYFGKPALLLAPIEGAHLASLPPNPFGYARRFRDGRVDDGWLHRLYDLMATMQRRGILSLSQLVAARSSRLELQKI
jgi:Transglycosylase